MTKKSNDKYKRKKRYRKYPVYKGYKWLGKSAVGMYDIAHMAAKNLIKYYVNTELNFIDTSVSASIPYDLVTYYSAQLCTQGDTASSRAGDSIHLRSIQFRLNLSIGTVVTDQRVRVFLVRDSQCNGTQLTSAQVMANSTSLESFLNTQYGKRFTVIYDKIHHLDQTQHKNKEIKFYKDIDDVIEYGGNAGTVADIRNTNYVLFAICDQTNASGNAGAMNGFLRVRYLDN